MRSANLFGPLKGHCPYKALIGLTQASGLAGGFDLRNTEATLLYYEFSIGFYTDPRHTFATLALQNGVDVKTVSGMLGHYSAGFTLDTYAHVTTAA